MGNRLESEDWELLILTGSYGQAVSWMTQALWKWRMSNWGLREAANFLEVPRRLRAQRRLEAEGYRDAMWESSDGFDGPRVIRGVATIWSLVASEQMDGGVGRALEKPDVEAHGGPSSIMSERKSTGSRWEEELEERTPYPGHPSMWQSWQRNQEQ